jgi:aspartate/methionine/tyrosine aminotransferase
VAVVPGEHFFAPGHLRISFAVDGKLMEKGFQRMREVLTS